MPVGHLAGMFNAQGPNLNCLTACAASSQAIGEAAELVRRGDADVMLSGGTHSMIHPFGVTGFNLLTALSTRNDEPIRASRPFDRDRDGFVLGEGAAMVVLEELEHAKARAQKSMVNYSDTVRPPTPIELQILTPKAGVRPPVFVLRCRMLGWIPVRSITSMPTARAQASMIVLKRLPLRMCLGLARIKFRFQVQKA